MSEFLRKIEAYDILLFDFDGLLVDTEFLHFRAYKKMCLQRGVVLPWDFPTYCELAHRGSQLVRNALYQMFPSLYEQEPNWSVLHKEKQQCLLDILSQEKVQLMPGVEKVLEVLSKKKMVSCVVTNSPFELIEEMRKQNSVLEVINHWVTREKYLNPKPAPDSYLTALSLYGKKGARAIGFEDTIRGWRALDAAGIEGIVVSSCLTQDMKKELSDRGVVFYSSFNDLFD